MVNRISKGNQINNDKKIENNNNKDNKNNYEKREYNDYQSKTMKVDSTNKKFNFINSSKKDINNDNSIEPDKDIKHNYKYNDKTYHGKIKFADNVEKKKEIEK